MNKQTLIDAAHRASYRPDRLTAFLNALVVIVGMTGILYGAFFVWT